MPSLLSRLLGATLLVTLTADSPGQIADNNPLVGGIPATAVRALPAPPAVNTDRGGNQNRTNLAGLALNASRVPDRAIRPVPGGARADFGLLKVFFPLDAKAGTPLTITTADGRTLACRATFLALHDLASDQSLLLAEVTNRVGMITGDHEVIYTNCFDTLNASLRYRISAEGSTLEQDILLAEFGDRVPKEFSPENVRLEVWTAWFDAEPVARATQTIDLRGNDKSGLLAPSLMQNERVDFGTAKIVDGHAFSSTAQDEQTPVGKTWARISNQDWLVETVDYLAVKSKLDLLPGSKRSAGITPPKSKREELIRSLAARAHPSLNHGAQMLMANASAATQPEFVMDFVIVSSVPVPAGIVSWWPAGGNANDAITNNHGTLYNGGTYAAGKVGQAFNFDGNNDHVRIPNQPNLRFTNAVTFEGWVYPTNTSYYREILSKWDAVWGYSQESFDCSLYPGGQFYILVSPTGTDSGATFVLSSNAVPVNTWTHVAGTYDGSTLKVYLNGVLDGEGVYANGIFPGTNSLGIGAATGGASPGSMLTPFPGMIDEPSLYARALGASEIQAIYNAGAAGKHNPNCAAPPTNLVAWWAGDGNNYDLARTNFATLSNVTYESAAVGQGFYFNGTSAGVTAVNDQILNLGANDDLTIEAWILAGTNSSAGYGVTSIAGKRYAPSSGSAVGYELFLSYGVPGFQIANASGYANFGTTRDLRGSGYHHLVVTMDRDATNGGAIYIDGSSVLTFNPTVLSGSLSNAEPFRIGKHPQSGFNGWYKGVIDEVTVYRRALTGTEITALYSAGSAGKCKVDTDGDGLTDLQESFLGTSSSDNDSDHDGFLDGEEVFVLHTNPLISDADLDGNGTKDIQEDTNGNGIPNGIEILMGFDPSTTNSLGNLLTPGYSIWMAAPRTKSNLP